MTCEDDGRAQFDADCARAQEDEARAAESVAAEAEARAQEEASEPLRSFAPRDRVALWERRGALEITNLGTIVKVSRSGYIHVEWDDHTEGWFSPVKATGSLRKATGDDALPRHVWIFYVPEREAPGWRESGAPLPTLDEPVCVICREKQTDENEFGPCRKAQA